MTDPTSPRRWATWILHRCCAPAHLEDIEGDLAEQFHAQRQRQGVLRASLTYWIDVLRFAAAPHLRRNRRSAYDKARGPVMLKNYLKITFRTLHRDRFYASLNLLGLMVGITGFLVLALFVRNELTYDRFHEDADNVYRLTTYSSTENREARYALVQGYLDPLLEDQIPEVAAATTLFSVQDDMVLRNGNHSFTEQKGFYTDADFSQVFTFEMQVGDPSTMLQEPRSIVLTDAMARRYFGAKNPVGQTLEWVKPEESSTLTVTGVLAPLPENSHLQFDFLMPGAVMGSYWKDFFFAPDAGPMTYVYFRTRAAMPLRTVQRKVDLATESWKTAHHAGYEAGTAVWAHPVQRLTDVYFNATNDFEHTTGGNLTYVRIMMIVALFLLLVAGINYVNLSTARATRRAQEVGVRKVLGSSHANLIGQFLLEATTMSLLATLASVALAEMLLRNIVPDLLDVHLSLFAEPLLLGLALLIGLGLGLLAGLVPAFAMTRFHIVEVLKGKLVQGRERALSLRSVLVTLQFVVTIFLLTGVAVILRQIDYLEDKGLGYAQDHLVMIRYSDSEAEANWMAFQEAARQIPGLQQTGTVQYDPVSDQNQANVVPHMNGEDQAPIHVTWNHINYDLIPTMGMEIVEGRTFSRDFPADQHAVIINETARRAMGLDTAVGVKLHSWFTQEQGAPIIGVVRDFHFQSFNNPITPLILRLNPATEDILIARLDAADLPQTLSALETRWRESGMVAPFAYTFVNDRFEQLIQKERRLSSIMTAFTLVCLFIAGLGLIGLVSYVTEQRKKEIGIRKVVGATRLQIIALINRRFATSVGVAFLLALPLSWWATTRWLEDFAYHIEVTPWEYALAGVLMLAVAVLTISFQSFKAASANPVQSLRYE